MPRKLANLNVPESVWASLNEKVSGRLHAGRPYGLPCFETYQNSTGTFPNTPDSARCATIQSGLTKSDTLVAEFDSYHSASFGSCMATGEHCTLSPSILENPKQGTCHQGSVPDYYVEVAGVEDIQAALGFANEHDLPIITKNTGTTTRAKVPPQTPLESGTSSPSATEIRLYVT